MPTTIEQSIDDNSSIESVIDQGGDIAGIVGAEEGVVTQIVETQPPTLSELSDVDVITEGRQDGSVLVYSTSTSKWTSTLTLEKQLMNGGFF